MTNTTVVLKLEAPQVLRAIAVSWTENGVEILYKPKKARSKYRKFIPFSRLLFVEELQVPVKGKKFKVGYMESSMTVFTAQGKLTNVTPNAFVLESPQGKKIVVSNKADMTTSVTGKAPKIKIETKDQKFW